MIEVAGLTKRYGNVRAVNDLSFTVNPGVVTGFLGPNGAGKSTTMRMILGLDRPTEGIALINGQRYTDLNNPLRTVGALIDAKAVHPNRSAAAHLQWIAQSNGIPRSRVDEVLALVGLSDVAGKRAGGFSLGMGQRLGLATALLGDPGVLLLDEPVNGLDPEGIRWVRSFLKSLAAEGRAVLVSSHILSEMALTADELVVIGKGQLIAETSTYEFVKNASASNVLVRTKYLSEFQQLLREEHINFSRETDPEGRDVLVITDQSTDYIGALAYSTDIMLYELSERKASLEDAFIAMTGDKVQYRTDIPGA